VIICFWQLDVILSHSLSLQLFTGDVLRLGLVDLFTELLALLGHLIQRRIRKPIHKYSVEYSHLLLEVDVSHLIFFLHFVLNQV
jgi:hypothetical protein